MCDRWRKDDFVFHLQVRVHMCMIWLTFGQFSLCVKVIVDHLCLALVVEVCLEVHVLEADIHSLIFLGRGCFHFGVGIKMEKWFFCGMRIALWLIFIFVAGSSLTYMYVAVCVCVCFVVHGRSRVASMGK